MNKQDIVLRSEHLARRFTEAADQLDVLRDVNLEVAAGQCVAITGASGSGKSTLLQCLGGLESFNSGEVYVDGQPLSQLSDKERTLLRGKSLGFVYQFHHLLPQLTAFENIAIPLKIRGEETGTIEKKSFELLEAMGLADRASHLPSQLSGGERQRCAIARAVIGDPVCLLADEPTGNLDQQTAATVFDYLLSLTRKRGTAVIIVTHDASLAARCDRILRLAGGQLHEDHVD